MGRNELATILNSVSVLRTKKKKKENDVFLDQGPFGKKYKLWDLKSYRASVTIV